MPLSNSDLLFLSVTWNHDQLKFKEEKKTVKNPIQSYNKTNLLSHNYNDLSWATLCHPLCPPLPVPSFSPPIPPFPTPLPGNRMTKGEGMVAKWYTTLVYNNNILRENSGGLTASSFSFTIKHLSPPFDQAKQEVWC